MERRLLSCVTELHVWVVKRWAREKLSQIRLGFILCINRAYLTIDNDAALILDGIEPLDLSAILKARLINVKKGRELMTGLPDSEIEQLAPLSFIGHPGFFPNIVLNDECDKYHNIHIYTDGSLSCDDTTGVVRVGCAFVVYEYEVEIFSAKFKLVPYCTVPSGTFRNI